VRFIYVLSAIAREAIKRMKNVYTQLQLSKQTLSLQTKTLRAAAAQLSPFILRIKKTALGQVACSGCSELVFNFSHADSENFGWKYQHAG
jgi:hypothetical protein